MLLMRPATVVDSVTTSASPRRSFFSSGESGG